MRTRNNIIVLVSGAILAAGAIYFISCHSRPQLFTFYATNLRTSLFSGALTLGSFLLAMNTFIIVNLKKEVFENELYKKRVREHRKARPAYKHYGPLRNLNRVLLFTICAAFVSSVLQVTLGMLWQNQLSAVICIGSSVVVSAGVMSALVLVGRTMKDWFDFLEEGMSQSQDEAERAESVLQPSPEKSRRECEVGRP